MLKTKHLVLLAAVLVVLALVSFLQQRSHEDRTSRPAHTVLVAGAWEPDQVSRITVGYGDDPEAVVLRRDPDGWAVATAWDAAANLPRVEALLRALGGLGGEFRSDDADVLADYGLAGDETVSLHVFDNDGREVVALDVGARPERSPGNFVRRPGENAVYVTSTSLLTPLGLHNGPGRPQSRHFVELQAVDEDRNAVDAITLWDEHGERRLAKEFAMVEPAADDTTAAGPQVDRLTWEWRLTAPRDAALAKTRADGVLGALCRLRAVDVADPGADPAAYGLDEPSRRARLELEDGTSVDLVCGAKRESEDDPAGTWCRVGDDPTVWVVPDYALNGVFKTVDDLLPES